MSAINNDNLVEKLSFAIFNGAGAEELKNLRAAIHTTIADNQELYPDIFPKVFEGWLAGDHLKSNKYYKFLKFFLSTTNERRSDLRADQKKVTKQVLRFLKNKDDSFESSAVEDSSTVKSSQGNSVIHIQLLAISLQEQSRKCISELEDLRPNSDVGIQEQEMSLNWAKRLDQALVEIAHEIQILRLEHSNQDTSKFKEMIDELSQEFHSWIKNNKPELVDAVMRLTPATGFLGLLGVAGANMAWATPIVLAMCGGSKVISAIKEIKNTQ